MEAVSKSEFRAIPRNEQETEQDKAIRRVADAVHRVNEVIREAVESGISVELVRVSRFHEGRGNWGDQMIPLIRETAQAKQ